MSYSVTWSPRREVSCPFWYSTAMCKVSFFIAVVSFFFLFFGFFFVVVHFYWDSPLLSATNFNKGMGLQP